MHKIFLWLLVSIHSAACSADALQIVVLDVGEGQAILLKRENRGILIDTGHAGTARSLLDKLDQYRVTQLDHLMFTHLHPDHASGYFRIREAFPTAYIHDNGDPAALVSPIDMVRWTADALLADPNRQAIAVRERLDWMGVKIMPVWPERLEGTHLNRNSLVLLIEYASANALVMGDVDIEVERQLTNGKSLPKNIELLVAGHHGSRHSSHRPFLQAVNPEVCVISVNSGNVRGYPDASTVQRLKDNCSRLYRTDRYGDIRLTWQTGEVMIDKKQSAE
ncbi:MAG: MBL fold metallo-hydrolase [Gammaproteobacteria bacterium]|nr:MBL fold metallo-hydrolase [Gammaproteobacteria bacterium]